MAQVLGRPLAELAKPTQEVVLLPHNLSIGEALRTLAKANILSAPMVVATELEDVGDDSGEGMQASAQFLGWIDVADILQGFLTFVASTGQEVPSKMLALMTTLEKDGPAYFDKPLITLRGTDDASLVYQADGSRMTVLAAIQDLFLRTAQGETRAVHRIAVFDAHGEITSVISQMDVLRWMLGHHQELPFFRSTIDQLGLLTGKPPVVAVNPHSPALTAFAKMAEGRVSGAPVVADSGEFIANLSVSDLRLLTPEHFGVLALPVAEFLALAHGTAYLGYSATDSRHATLPFFASKARPGSRPQPSDIQLFTAQRTSSLLEVAKTMVDNHVHRVYVLVPGTEAHPHVGDVITITDVLRMVSGI